MSSTSDINDVERGVLEQGSSSLIPFTLAAQHSEPPSITNLSDPPTISLPLDQTTLERRKINDGKKELSKVPSIANIVGPENKKVPPKRRVSRWIQFKLWFNSYRKFFTFVMTLNLVGILLAALNVWMYARKYTGVFVLGNLFTAILIRNELFGRILYLIVNTLFAKWPPLWFRLGCTSVLQHLGGIHSGCAISGFFWLIFKVSLNFIQHRSNHDVILVFGMLTNLIVAVSVASAFPWIRDSHHNIFERHHRFAGWVGVLSTWVFVVLGDSYDLELHQWNPNGIHIIRQQDFWFVTGMTLL